MTGASHSSVKRYRELARHSLTNGHERELLLDGPHLLVEARKSGLTIESAAFEHDALADLSVRALAEQLVADGADVFIVSRKTLETMSPVRSPAGAVGIARRTLPSLAEALAATNPLVVVAHDVQDPGNVGGIMRTAEAAGATAFVTTAATADPLGWKALRGSMGSALRLPIARGEVADVMAALRAAGIRTSALVPRSGEPLFGSDFRQPSALMLGSEGAGLPEDVLRQVDRRLTIPMHGPVESLNVGVAAALVLYEAVQATKLMSLFEDPSTDAPAANIAGTPLAERMRPAGFDEFVGQQDILAPGKPLREAIEHDRLRSIILWGPPGTGKTTLARLIAKATRARFVSFSAVLAGIKEIKDVMAAAEVSRRQMNRRTIVFVDEIHRFNKSQQDAFLPRVEAGDIVLIGATTENPSFEVIAALLSRSKVYTLRGLAEKEVVTILERALRDKERGLGNEPIAVQEGVLQTIARFSNGDARAALNLLELTTAAAPREADGSTRTLSMETVQQSVQRRALLYDKSGEEHYNIMSALHKSMRNSDPDASVYWLARMLEAGEDPLYVARRLIRFASEDVGNADPQALTVAVAAKDAVHFIGMPEGNTALAQAAIYLATAPKSNAVYVAYNEAAEDAVRQIAEPVPLHIRNAPTKLMKDLSYGKGYKYAHDEAEGIADMDCLPPSLSGKAYYRPTGRGFEDTIRKRIQEWQQLRKKT